MPTEYSCMEFRTETPAVYCLRYLAQRCSRKGCWLVRQTWNYSMAQFWKLSKLELWQTVIKTLGQFPTINLARSHLAAPGHMISFSRIYSGTALKIHFCRTEKISLGLDSYSRDSWVRIWAVAWAVTTEVPFVVLLSPCRKIPGYCLNQDRIASFQILFSSWVTVPLTLFSLDTVSIVK
jgi:hypothetical protein